MTLKEKFIAALIKMGETKVKETSKYVVFTKKPEGFYYVGRAGALRRGLNVSSSYPCTDAFKAQLIASLN